MHHAAAVFGARAGKKIALEPTGTESGFDYFCAGTAKHMPDMNNASFAMTRPQFNNCRRNGVRDVLAFRIGFDGIVVFSAAAGPLNGLSLDALYRALAAEPVGAGTWALNKTRLWSEIDPRLAAEPIHVLGPPPTSGTRAFIEHEVLLPTCERLMGRPLSNIQQQSRCRAVRRDGPYIEVSEDDQFLINAALQSRHSIGLVGYGHFQQAGDSIKALTIDGVAPTYRDIASGDYPLSRPLFIYVKLTSDIAVARGGGKEPVDVGKQHHRHLSLRILHRADAPPITRRHQAFAFFAQARHPLRIHRPRSAAFSALIRVRSISAFSTVNTAAMCHAPNTSGSSATSRVTTT
jgi:phosphate transport system substrate-binding protein